MTLTETRTSQVPMRFVALFGLVLVADLIIWDVRPGIGIAFLVLLAGGVAAAFLQGASRTAWAVLILSCLPLVEKVQLVSLVFAWGGLTVFCAMLVADRAKLWATAIRLPFWALAQNVRDLSRAPQIKPHLDTKGLVEWIIPVLLGLVFIALFAAANPVIDGWVARVTGWQGPQLPDTARLVLWCLCAILFWPLLRLQNGVERLTRPIGSPRLTRTRILTAGSVLKSLATFNVIFAVQTLSDLAFLSGGVALPEGMTYATYAHRGAYPLLATALLAGGFALLAQPFLADRPALRWLLMAWVAQNVALVISSILRLDLYVDVYGLTRLRFAAFVWMGLVAGGLSLMVVQLARAKGAMWLLKGSAALGATALYICSFINIDGMIARHNLAKGGVALDAPYICRLSEDATPAIRSHEVSTGARLCYRYRPALHQPRDAREWGFRNARLRRSLAELEGTAS